VATTGLNTHSELSAYNDKRALSLTSVEVNPPCYGAKELRLRFDAQGDHNMGTGSGGLYARGDAAP
jgi:hypothetical protein